MISPYVKRLRLAQELRQLRAEADLTQAQMAKKIGKNRIDLSRLESGHTATQADVLSILEVLNIEGARWTKIATIAREASEQGWWEGVKNIGERQAFIANLEAGSSRIQGYEQTFMPGLLQTPEFVRARSEATQTLEPVSGTVEGIIAGRAGRRRMLRRPDGPSVELVLDEGAVHRLAAPPDVVKDQLYHLADAINTDANVVLRVLPSSARIKDYTVPRSAFTVFTYPDPDDPRIVTVDTVTSDLVLTDDEQVSAYERLYERLVDAALPPQASAEFLAAAADRLND